MLAHQLAHDREMRVIDRLHDLIVQGAKGLVVLNGGAVVAMLAFVQALLDKTAYQCFKPYALSALSCFLAGAFFAAVAFFFHHTYISHTYRDTEEGTKWGKVVWGVLITSSTCAFAGGGLVAIGVWAAV